MTAKPVTAIIGAGISGLTAAKNLQDANVDYEVFEISDREGGNWAFRNPNGYSSAYRSLHIDTSKNMLSFRDFPMSKETPTFPHHTDIHRYLEDYARTFRLYDRIHLNNGVEHAERLSSGGWRLTTQDGEIRFYDSLIVANGHHWDARYPEFAGTFTGESIHAHEYIDPTEPLDLKGKRIVVVGIGNSGADLVSELSQRAWQNEVYLSTRSGAWVVPKYILGKTAEEIAKPHPAMPRALRRWVLRKLQRPLLGNPEDFGLPTPNHDFGEAHPTQSAELLMRLAAGDATAKPNIDHFEGRTVHFADGTAVEADVVIYATGYNITFPFFDPEFISAPDNSISLYKRMFKPGMEDLIFIGFAQAVPTLFPFVECQSRVAAAYLQGNYQLPDVDQMQRTIAEDEALHIGNAPATARHTQQVDYYDYVRDIERHELPAGRLRAQQASPTDLLRRRPPSAASVEAADSMRAESIAS